MLATPPCPFLLVQKHGCGSDKIEKSQAVEIFLSCPPTWIRPRLKPRRRSVWSGHRLAIFATAKISLRRSNPDTPQAVAGLWAANIQKNCPPTWIRTRDLTLKRRLLYQLSYGRNSYVAHREVLTACPVVSLLYYWGAMGGFGKCKMKNTKCKGLAKLSNVVLTPHIASGTIVAREEMAHMAAENLIVFFEGKVPPNIVK